MTGKLIVFEGLDASGKRTQCELLIKKLRKDGFSTVLFDFPRYDSFFGKLIGKYLKGEFRELNPYITALLFALDRADIKDEIIDNIRNKKIIIINRYVGSNKAFQSARLKDWKEREILIKWVDELEYLKNNLPQEDMVIYLNVPTETATKLQDKKGYRSYMGNNEKDIHERDIKYLKEVENIYYKELLKDEKWVKIDCVIEDRLLSPEVISDNVWDVVKKVINV
jgi:dTMP kinase